MPTDRGDDGKRKPEQHRDPEPVDHAGKDVAGLVVGAERVLARSGVRGGRGVGRLLDVGVVANSAAAGQSIQPLALIAGLELGVGEIGFGGDEGRRRTVSSAVVVQAPGRTSDGPRSEIEKRAVVGEEFGEQRSEQKQR